MSYNYRVIRAAELDKAMLQKWKGIQNANSYLKSPYFCPEFTKLVSLVRKDVWIVVIEEYGAPVGFFPYQKSPMLGVSKPVGGPFSDYHGVICEKSVKWGLKSLLNTAGLNVWLFDHVPVNFSQFEKYCTHLCVSPQIDIADGFSEFVRQNKKSGSSYIKKTEGLARKLEREYGELTFNLHETGDEALELLKSWKSQQYKRSGIVDAFHVEWTGQLLRMIMDTQEADFAGLCSTLRLNGKIIAVHMGMRSKEILHYWFPAYDVKFAKFSPGIILLLRIAQALDDTSVHTIDLGKGNDLYKKRLMNCCVTLQEGAVEVPSLISGARQILRTANRLAERGELGGY